MAGQLFRYYGHALLPEERPLENSGLKVLQHLSLKVTPPDQFNDLFEVSPVIERPVSKAEAESKSQGSNWRRLSGAGLARRFGQ